MAYSMRQTNYNRMLKWVSTEKQPTSWICLKRQVSTKRYRITERSVDNHKDDTSGSAYFKFREEQAWDVEPVAPEQSLFQVNLDQFEGILSQADSQAVLDLAEQDAELVKKRLEGG